MNNLNLKDKIDGAIYGCAIGDALGLATEFMTKEEVKVRYPDGINDYSDIYPDAHRLMWEQGDWTNDTETIIRLLNAIVDSDEYDVHAIARAFRDWYLEGHEDVVAQYRFIFNNPEYTDDPERVSYDTWMRMGGCDASNEANGRAVFIGMLKNDHLDRSAQICRITHPDPRCIGSSLAIAQMAHDIVWNHRLSTPEEISGIVRKVDDRVVPYVRWALKDSLDAFDLDDEDTLWYTRKAMGCALWALWHDLTPMEAFQAIAGEGGDADTNASTALALLGLRYGPEAFPENLKEGLIQRSRLDHTAERWHDFFLRKY